ncbi:MAG: PepSY-like domain-containing protein, partial [Bacteroides sp.]|nr:PepSY-like domain-containing protein [Bacteroides sp.]
MKTIKWNLLAIICVSLMSFTSCDSDDDFRPESSYMEALAAKYPNATYVEWDRKGEYHVADCRVDNKDLDVWFSATAEWKMTETDLLVSDLPAAITQAIAASEYADWFIDEVDLLEYPSKAKEYVIEVERNNQEMDLY